MTAEDLAQRLPSISKVKALSMSFAVLDEILSLGSYAGYSFDTQWAEGAQLASMSNGSGDEYSIVFTPDGAFIRGFDHESEMSPYRDDGTYATWPGLIETVPPEFAAQVAEPAFHHDIGTETVLAATVCLWRLNDSPTWQTGEIAYPQKSGLEDVDGSGWMFGMLAEGTPEAYLAYAEEYFEAALDIADITQILQHRPLSEELVQRINPEATLTGLRAALETIGYPRKSTARAS